MIVTADNVTLTLNAEDVQRLRCMTGEEDAGAILKAAVAGVRHIVAVSSAEFAGPPVLLDAHVFLASKMLEDEAAPVDRQAIEAVLEAWRDAEAQLHPEARLAIRLLEPLTTLVLMAKDRATFEDRFQADFVPKLPIKAARFVRSYVEVMQGWMEGGVPPGEQGHYLEHVVGNVFRSVVAKATGKKGGAHCTKRLAALKDTLDSYLFD